ncbi:hypothetical protein PM082_014188 [Marasmius tenuissimus]|nr:hypothetical protein PM082_014188 [Marasmius tenuissimus]
MRQFDACSLCLNKAREPVACNEGHLFCKECVYTDLYADLRIAKLRNGILDVVPIPPSIANIFDSNDPPFTVLGHRAVVKFRTHETSHLVASLNPQIMDLQPSLEALVRQRDVLKHHLERSQTVYNPLRQSPYDLLSYILRICVDRDVRDIIAEESIFDRQQGHHDFASTRWAFCGSLDTRKGPWVLGQLCRIWRVTVVSSPLLCTSVHVGSSAVFSRHCHDMLAGLLL